MKACAHGQLEVSNLSRLKSKSPGTIPWGRFGCVPSRDFFFEIRFLKLRQSHSILLFDCEWLKAEPSLL